MGEKQYSPVTQYLCGMQSVFFQHSPPVTSSGYTWHHPIHSETSHIPLQFTGQVRPTPLNVISKPYIALNQALGLNQENIQILSGPVWDQARPWPNKVQVVAQSQGRPILGVHNQEHITTDFMNKAEKRADIMPDTTNCTDWVSGNSNYTRECLGYSAVLKRPHPSTPDPRQKKSCHKIYQIVTDPSRNSHSRAPYKCLGVNTSIPPPVIPQRNSSHQENKESSERYFKTLATSPSNPVELHVTNLDQSIDSLELKEILMAAFREHIMVLHLSIFVQSDGNLAASVKVPSVQDAQYAISQLHRRKVGYKRIVIAYAHSGSSQNPQFIRTQIYSLLSEVPGYRLPLFTFRDLFESRYLTSLSVSELYRMRDICIITDENSGRTIYLNPEYRSTPSPRMFTSNNEIGQHNMEVPYCIRHGHSQQLSCEKGWAEQELPTLPNIRVKLSEFSSNIQALLRSHNDFLPLASLMDCYAGEFETLTVDETGVPLEHLVTWVPNVELAVNLGCVKYLRPAESKPSQPEKVEDGIKKCASPSLANQLSLFSHELVDLLKTQPKNNQLMFNRFIPAYHHHFGRQCRVADYGFTKLIDLFEALPHVIQVIGEGNKRIVALAHHAQIRRFTSDLLRVIKSQANKQLKVSELSFLFGVTLGRVFDPVDYGLCYLEDLLAQLSENIVVVSGTGTSTLIAIPKREQTSEEIERTKRFALEVVELLSHAPQCSMFFSKFIPAYHHHYGHQCRVLDYGFPKLIDLFEAIPHIVKIEDSRERERRVTLTNDKKIMVLNNQIVDLVCANYPPGLPISSLNNAFLRQFGYALKPMAYGCDNLEQLIEKLQASFKVVNFGKEPLLTPGNQTQLHQLSLRIFRILMVNDDAKMTCLEFYQAYESLYNESCCLELLENELNDFIKMTHRGIATVELTNLQLFARNVYKILYMADGRLARNSFDATYFNMFGKVIKPSQYNCQSVNALLNAISHVVVQGKGAKHILILNEELGSVGISLPPGFQRSSSNQNVAKPFQNGSSTESQHDSQADSLKQNSPPQKQKALIQALNNCQDHDSKDSKSSADLEKIWPNNSTTCFIYDGQVPVINLPEPCTPPDPEVCASLYSPYKILLPANPFYYSTPRMKRIISPHPSELVLPPSYLTNSNPEPITEGDESADSGLVTSATDLVPDCDSGSNSSMSTLSNNGKRKVRLAAQFNIPLN